MKTITKLMLASTALVGGVASAQVITVPPTVAGGSDLVLFVTDTLNGASFVQDLGVNLDSLGVTTASVAADVSAGNLYNTVGLGTTGPLGSGAAIQVASGLINSSGVDSALATFEAANTGGTFYYGIVAAYAGGTVASGSSRFAAAYTATNGATQFTDGANSGNIVNAATSTTAFFANVNAATTFYDAPSGSGAQAVGSFGITSGSNGSALGGTTYLYELASTGKNGNEANVYASNDAITVGLGGVISGLTSGSTAPVPLPAAVWLLGSGVLGLFGIGRRRVAKAAA